jgi:hypothetical protein
VADPNDPCFACKPKEAAPVPPPAAGGDWPTPGDAIEAYIYIIGPLPSGYGVELVAWGAEYITAHGVGAFGWIWPSSGPAATSGGGIYSTLYLNFFDGAGQRAVGTGVPGETAQYQTMEEAQAVVQDFQQYFYG